MRSLIVPENTEAATPDEPEEPDAPDAPDAPEDGEKPEKMEEEVRLDKKVEE